MSINKSVDFLRLVFRGAAGWRWVEMGAGEF
jgi:hypothetical protein